MSEINGLVDEYVKLIQEHAQYKEKGDYKRANSLHARISKISKKLLSLNDYGQKALSELLDHNNRSVRAWAAADYYIVDQTRSKSVLRKLEEEGGLIGLEAGLLLRAKERGIK